MMAVNNSYTKCLFKTSISPYEENQCMALLGSNQELGGWDPKEAILATKMDVGSWMVDVALPSRSLIEYKWVMINEINGKLVSYEPGNNRVVWIDNTSLLIEDSIYGGQQIREISVEDMATFQRPKQHDSLGEELAMNRMDSQSREDVHGVTYEDIEVDNVAPEIKEEEKSHVWTSFTSALKKNAGTMMKIGLIAGAMLSAAFVIKRIIK